MRPNVTVAIPTFNGEESIADVLTAVASQQYEDFEILVVDSGSVDATLEKIDRFETRLMTIPNEEFGHGRTRNLMMELSQGRFVAFLSQDAIPASTLWLQNLIDGFSLEARVAAVFGMHLPRPDADPKTRRDLSTLFDSFGPRDRPTLQRQGDPFFFSDVNGALSKDLWKQIPYRDLDYAEDQALGLDILNAGLYKVYEPRAAVIHSHDYRATEYLKRQFDEWSGLRKAVGVEEHYTLPKVALGSLKGSFRDIRMIMRETNGIGTTLQLSTKVGWMNFARRLGSYLAEREERLPAWVRHSLSQQRTLRSK